MGSGYRPKRVYRNTLLSSRHLRQIREAERELNSEARKIADAWQNQQILDRYNARNSVLSTDICHPLK